MGPIHPTYLPYSPAELVQHFVGGVDAVSDPRLAYYRNSAKAAAAFAAAVPDADPTTYASAVRRGRQMEKDERFWIVAALMTIFHAPDRIGTLGRMLTRCLGDVHNALGLSDWAEALGPDPMLYFEANLPAPPSYRSWLAEHLDDRIRTVRASSS